MLTFEPARRLHVGPQSCADPAAPRLSQAARPQVRHILETPHIQPRLTIGPPDDEFEQEADRIADQVMRMPTNAGAAAGITPPRIQPKCTECEEEEKKLHRSPTKSGADTPQVTPELESDIESLRGGGEPLSASARRFFEPRLASDLGTVRVHTNDQAAESSRSIQARAYTVGEHIVFGRSEYAPDNDSGRRLLAHELTHVLQQGGQSHAVRRFVSCEGADTCPRRGRGEGARSKTTPHQVEDHASPTFGILISNFAIGESQEKPDLHGNPTWVILQTQIGRVAADEWEILGFTDCQGDATSNTALRQERADAVAALLPAPARARVRTVSGATLSDCIANNLSEPSRRRNRSVLIRRIPGSTGPTAPSGPTMVGPVRPPRTPPLFCVPYGDPVSPALDRAFLEAVWLPFTQSQFGTEVHDLWRDYLNRPKGASLTPRVFKGAGNPIVDAFRTDPQTVLHERLLFADIVKAAARTPEATIPLAGTSFTSPPIELGTLLPASALDRTINYTHAATRIPGNIAGGTGVMGTASSDAGPDLRLFTGTVRISRTRAGPGASEVRAATVELQLQVIDAVDFCPGNPGGALEQTFTIPMSRLEATQTELTYDLPFHVFVDLSATVPIP